MPKTAPIISQVIFDVFDCEPAKYAPPSPIKGINNGISTPYACL